MRCLTEKRQSGKFFVLVGVAATSTTNTSNEYSGLLVKYTILQIWSDASFCLQKWQIKGGGAPSYGEGNHNCGLEKWLWRALWDIYVAADVMSTYAPDIYGDVMKKCEPYVSSSDLSSIGDK